MINSATYKRNESIGEIMTLKDTTRYKMVRKGGIPYSKDLITKLQSLFGENLVVDPCFYLIPLQKKLQRKYISTKSVDINELSEVPNTALLKGRDK